MTRYLTIYFAAWGVALHLLIAYLCAGAAWTHLQYWATYSKWLRRQRAALRAKWFVLKLKWYLFTREWTKD